MKKSLLFLDVDGVLNSEKFFRSLWDAGKRAEKEIDMLDPAPIDLLSALLQDVDCDVILSSAWRKIVSLPSMMRFLRTKGGDIRLHDKTPTVHHLKMNWRRIETDVGRKHKMSSSVLDHKERGLEIEYWIRSNYKPEDFADLCVAILDDSNDMHTLLPRLVRTSYETGLTESDVERLRSMLTTPMGDLLAPVNPWFFDKFAPKN